MTSTSANEPFVTSSVAQLDWASPSSPNRSLLDILFLSSEAKNPCLLYTGTLGCFSG